MGTFIQTISNPKGASVRLVISEANWLETDAVDQLKRTAQLPGMCLGVGMPDLHPGRGQPIGAAFITKGIVYPHLVGSDIGCGMGLWKLDVTQRKVKIDKWEKKLVGLDDPWDGDRTEWITAHGHHRLTAVDGQTVNDGCTSVDVDLMNDSLLNEKLGTIGGGNHFAEIQAVNEIFDSAVLTKSGLDKSSVVLLVHSGSRGLGQYILRNHVDRYGGMGLSGRDAADYLDKHHKAVCWGVANRALIARRFSKALGVHEDKVLDIAHNTVQQLDDQSRLAMASSELLLEEENDSYWIHRKGVSPTDSGLVMIPGSRGSLSYLVSPVDDLADLAQGGFSLAHGAGRKWKRSDARGKLEKRFNAKDLEQTELGSRVICKSKDLLFEEAPQAYKNIDVVVQDLVDANLVKLVASFKPLISYKTRKK